MDKGDYGGQIGLGGGVGHGHGLRGNDKNVGHPGCIEEFAHASLLVETD
jgi:hypothetical protein